MLKDRDFLYREVTQKLPNGVVVIYGQSLSQEEEQQVESVPSIKGVIRGEMGASGWVIAPVNGGAASSVTYVALTDLKVSIHMASRHLFLRFSMIIRIPGKAAHDWQAEQ